MEFPEMKNFNLLKPGNIQTSSRKKQPLKKEFFGRFGLPFPLSVGNYPHENWSV